MRIRIRFAKPSKVRHGMEGPTARSRQAVARSHEEGTRSSEGGDRWDSRISARGGPPQAQETGGVYLRDGAPARPQRYGAVYMRHNRRLALAAATLLTTAALMAGVLGLWRIGADLRWTNGFAISSGLFSHWQVWLGAALGLEVCAHILNRYGNGGDAAVS